MTPSRSLHGRRPHSSETHLSFPVRIAAIDTGSNAIRFVAAEFTSPTEWTVLDSERAPVRLGHQVFLDGRLTRTTMTAAVDAFRHFRERIDALRIETVRAVATSAVREARNGPELVERIRTATGIDLEIISGAEEARLAHGAVAHRIPLAGGSWVLVDLGGGSVEVSLVDDSGMLWTESHTMGSVRLLEELTGVDRDPGRFRRILEDYIALLRIPASTRYREPAGLIATGGNMEALAELCPSAITDSRGVVHVDVSELRGVVTLLGTLSYRDRISRLDLKEDRADVILPAGMVYLRIAELCGVKTILVPGIGVREGILLDLVESLDFSSAEDARRDLRLTRAAVALGRKFLFDEEHGHHVATLALSLFDQLRDLHGLDGAERSLLKTAAILHDIGTFVSLKKHHRHSLYLLENSDLPGLTEEEMRIVGHVARYQRKSLPSPRHLGYMLLPPGDRMLVNQLAAFLRIAKALDGRRRGAVRGVTAEVRGLDLRLALAGTDDLLFERWAVSRAKDLFEETFGLRVFAM